MSLVQQKVDSESEALHEQFPYWYSCSCEGKVREKKREKREREREREERERERERREREEGREERERRVR